MNCSVVLNYQLLRVMISEPKTSRRSGHTSSPDHLALIGSVAALWMAGQPLSVASMIGFITLTSVTSRNGTVQITLPAGKTVQAKF